MKIEKDDWFAFIVFFPVLFLIYLKFNSSIIALLNDIWFIGENYYWKIFYTARGVASINTTSYLVKDDYKTIRCCILLIEIMIFMRLLLFFIFPTYSKKKKWEFRFYDFMLLYIIRAIKYTQEKCEKVLLRFLFRFF